MLVIGLGNRWRNDDGVGFEVIETLQRQGSISELVASDDVLSLIDRWASEDLVVIVDAVSSGAPAGTLHRFDVTDAPLPVHWRFSSSHEVGLAHAIEIGRAFDRFPSRLVIVAIEGGDFECGNQLSQPVRAAVPLAADAVLAYLPTRVA